MIKYTRLGMFGMFLFLAVAARPVGTHALGGCTTKIGDMQGHILS